jgi:hypothetical protein
MNRLARRSRSLFVAIALSTAIALPTAAAAADLATTPATTPDTVAPDTTPVTVTTPGTVPDGGGGDDSDVPWPLIIAIAAVAIALIALIATAAGRRRRPSSAGGAAPYRASTADQDKGYALGAAQWIHDHFSAELLSATPGQAAQRWNADRGRLDDATIRAQRFSGGDDGIMWQRLGQSLSLLGTSLDSYIQLRNQDPPNQQLIEEAYAVANRHRAELGQQLAALWPTVQR